MLHPPAPGGAKRAALLVALFLMSPQVLAADAIEDKDKLCGTCHGEIGGTLGLTPIPASSAEVLWRSVSSRRRFSE
jgi:hypothetical protein